MPSQHLGVSDNHLADCDLCGEDLRIRVIAKEAVENSWGILNAILCHKYHQSHLNRVTSSE